MRVECEVQEAEIEDEDAAVLSRPGVRAECGRCGHETASFGIGESSHKRCLVLMREECPNGERNFYVEGD